MNEKTDHSSNVDPEEIAKFEALAHRWWDRDSEFKPLHDMNPLRLDYIERFTPMAGMKILDVGCGGGILSEGMARAGATVTAIDMGEAPLSVAKLHLLESQLEVEYRQIPVEALAEEQPNQYDIITCMEMLEHVPDPSSTIQACSDLVKPEGHLFFSTINRNLKSYMMAIIGAEYVLNLLPKGTHEHDKFIKPAEMEQWTRHANLALDDLTGMHYNPLTMVYSLGSNVDVNYFAHARPLQD
ncbi:MAG: bifunctional 2-polyprenyl-6-hydroxyphenol methylase/3-demethylubiquinol 3-O-methyltransferase UbiG [Gammaproteobacteria bacterium]|jgi:2-polyprenyl-6-hydroxyphenyl methylase / 3-demethylubiquinone-9 3-methyltransferase|nr:bifunctional 2-polyprenyl-6-hydroxyphenol methylase/3-demethylubiquinol 3-O-methyltransferase UbiG [Gammaproteobacteria bacterium]MBT6079135.1 bifunctional 2-polyprenyl-6-hydroxyphenol methylase/3-demethylubiquinol 3-O-methyltransferase UbiG [Gammaproteobacteria bacterium]MBT7229409.1 bifunctional 2-polyprenyl-6-hydroxyphenol methylase/3-demethylubiquinol 3-O-methyltransferase UbiG [Gammaproteobacteria bacterium]MBT8007970.1 bifunctional 2-polyprenyl-6-hydroxyphenol methylase/3-demethylubiqui